MAVLSTIFKAIWFVIKHIFLGIFFVIIGIVEFFDGIFDWLRSVDSYSFRQRLKSIFLFPFKVLRLVFTKIIDFVKWFFKTFADAITWFIKLILFVVTLKFLFGSNENTRQNSKVLYDRLSPKSKK